MADYTFSQLKQINALRAKLKATEATDIDEQIKLLKDSFKETNLGIDKVGKQNSGDLELPSLDISLDSNTVTATQDAQISQVNKDKGFFSENQFNTEELSDFSLFSQPTKGMRPESSVEGTAILEDLIKPKETKFNYTLPNDVQNWDLNNIMDKFNEAIAYKKKTGKNLIDFLGNEIKVDLTIDEAGMTRNQDGFTDLVEKVIFTQQGFDWNKFNKLQKESDSLNVRYEEMTDIMSVWNSLYADRRTSKKGSNDGTSEYPYSPDLGADGKGQIIYDQGVIINDKEKRDRILNSPEFDELFEYNERFGSIKYKGTKNMAGMAYVPSGFRTDDDYSLMGKINERQNKIAETLTNPIYLDMMDKSKEIIQEFSTLKTNAIKSDMVKLEEAFKRTESKFSEVTNSSYSQENINAIEKGFEEKFAALDEQLLNYTDDLSVFLAGTFKAKNQEDLDAVNSILQQYKVLQEEVNGINNVFSEFSLIADKSNKVTAQGIGLSLALSDGEVMNYEGTYVDTVVEGLLNDWIISFNQGQINIESVRILNGWRNEEDYSDAVSRMFAHKQQAMGLMTTETMSRYKKAKTAQEQFALLKKDPFEIVSDLVVASLGQFVATGLSAESILPSAGVYGVQSASQGNLISGIPNAMITWQTITALNMEIGNALGTEMQKEATARGIDPKELWTNKDVFLEIMSDKEVIKRAQTLGLKRGPIIALMSFVGAKGTQLLVRNAALQSGRRQLLTTGGVLGLDAATEATGEGIALAWGEGLGFGDDRFYVDINNEVLGGLGSTSGVAATEVLTGKYYNTAAKNAKKLENLNYVINSNFDSKKVTRFVNKLFDSNRITEDQKNKILENQLVVDEINKGIETTTSASAKRKLKTNAKVRKRLSDLFHTKNLIIKLGKSSGKINAKKNLDAIQLEIDNIFETGQVMTDMSDQFTTINDYMAQATSGVENGIKFLQQLGLDSEISLSRIDEKGNINNKELLAWVIANQGEIKNEEQATAWLKNYLKPTKNKLVSAFITPYKKGEKQFVLVADENIKIGAMQTVFGDQKSFGTGAVAMSHEILHAIIDRSFTEDKVIEIGKMLENYLDEGLGEVENQTISKGTIDNIKNRMKAAEKKHGKGTANYYQEVFTSISDEMMLNNISWERADKKFYQKIADSFTDFFKYNLNMSPDIINGANISTGKQAFDFLKTYNNSFLRGGKGTVIQGNNQNFSSKGVFRNSEINAVASGIMGGLDVMKNKSMSKEDYDKISNQIIGEIYPMLDGIVAARITQAMQKLPDFNREDFIAETKVELIPHIRSFNPEKNNNLAAWIKSQAVNKGLNVLKSGKTTNKSFTSELSDDNISNLEDETSLIEEKGKTWFDLLEIKEDNPIYKSVANNVITVLGSKLPLITELDFKKKLNKAFEDQLYDIIFYDIFGHTRGLRGNQNLEVYTTFLETYGEDIYNELDQSVINKNYQEFMVNLGRANTVFSDKMPNIKNRTAGNLITTKKPWSEVKSTFVDYFTKSLSKKESLAKVLSKQLGADATIDVLENNKNARNRFAGNQEITNNDQLAISAALLAKEINRGTPDIRNSEIIQDLANIGLTPEEFNSEINSKNFHDLSPELQGVIRQKAEDLINMPPENTGFIGTIKNMIGLSPETKAYVDDKKYNQIYKHYPRVPGTNDKIIIGKNKKGENIYKTRYIAKVDDMQEYLEEFVFAGYEYFPSDQINNSENVSNQNNNWISKVHDKNMGSTRSGLPVSSVAMYGFNGELISEADQISMSDEQHEELVEVSKERFKKLRADALNKAKKSKKPKFSEKTKELWDSFDINEVILGNKGAAKLGHILSIAKDIANEDISAQEKIDKLISIIGPEGIAAIKAGKAFMKAYNSSINDMVSDYVKGNKPKSTIINHIINNYQKTTNAVYSARAYAAFSSFYFEDGNQKINDKFTGWKGEHVDDSSTVTAALVKSFINNSYLQDIDGVIQGFEQSFMPENLTKILDKIGGKNSPLGNLRFLLDPEIGKKIYSIFNSDNMYNVALEEFRARLAQEVGQQVRLDNSNKLRNSETIGDGKIRVFDFDDTLAQSNSQVLYTLPNGKTGKLNATQFAAKSAALEDKGAVFDFTQFNEVIDGKKGPLFEVAQAIQNKKGTENVFVLTARPQKAAKAIKTFLDGVGLNIPLSNITGLEDGKAEAKAKWIENKIEEGYNDFYFADDAIKNVAAVKNLLDQYDVKGKTQLAKLRNSESLNTQFNQILFDVSKVPVDEIFSDQRAKRTKTMIKQNKFFLPPSAEDFEGLIYQFLGKGKIGEEQMTWFENNLLKPFGRAINAMNVARMRVKNQYDAIKKEYPSISGYNKTLGISLESKSFLNKKSDYSGFTNGDAARVYMWNRAGYVIPGLSDQDLKALNDIVENNPELKEYANKVYNLFAEGYVKPDESWEVGNIESDIQNASVIANRELYLKNFIEASESIFGPTNSSGLLSGPTANKIAAIYGADFLEALSDSLYRMKTGRHRAMGTSKVVNGFLNWINNSIAVVMFVNARSAVLQSISSINFVNWTDNNPLRAAMAIANFPQFLQDFVKIFNSDFLKSRRSGNKFDVSADEIAAYVKGKGNKVKAMFNWFMRNGFVLTQMVDSWAIASGGATFFRNRTQTYQAEGFSLAEAEEKAFFDMQENAEKSQQSSRPDKISSQQAGSLGRLVLAFANTPMQYNRLMKKAYLDAKNGRGDLKTNLSKIAYYALAQNYIFNALQQALFGVLFEDDDPCEGKTGSDLEKCKKKQESLLEKNLSVANSMLDSLLRGSGVYGAIGSTIKNMMWEARKQSKKDRPKYVKVAERALSISPPIASKYTRLKGAALAVDYNKEEMMALGLDIDNPAILATGQVISAVTNAPVDRIITKVDNIRTAMEENTKMWQSIFLMAGWDQYSLGINKYELPEEKKKIVDEYKENLKDKKGTTKKKKKRKLIIN